MKKEPGSYSSAESSREKRTTSSWIVDKISLCVQHHRLNHISLSHICVKYPSRQRQSFYVRWNQVINILPQAPLFLAFCVDLQQQTLQVSVNRFLTRYQRGVGHFPPGVDGPAGQSYQSNLTSLAVSTSPPQRRKRTGLWQLLWHLPWEQAVVQSLILNRYSCINTENDCLAFAW